MSIITRTISQMNMLKEDYTGETKLSIETQMKLLELAEKELNRVLDRNKTSELKQHFNNIGVRLGTVQELKYNMQEQLDGLSQRRHGRN